jgi:FMN phosphatase YigB (HAD superfamily)
MESGYNLKAVCEGAGLAALFAVLVDSHCVGAEKPDPAIFQVALDKLRASPETTVFVGDSLRRDREGARRMGMRFIWMMPQGGLEQPVEHAVTELPELMRILQ